MLRCLQNPKSLWRRVLSILACAALSLHAVVPTGYMFERDAQTGALTVVLCSSQGYLPVIRQAADVDQHAGHLGHQDSDEHGSHDTADGVCAFTLVTASLIKPSIATTVNFLGDMTGQIATYRSAVLPAFTHTAIPARGPPIHS